MQKKSLKLGLLLIVTLFLTSTITIAKDYPDDEDIDQARKTVKLLDDLYKTFIELITEEYVKNPDLLSAATLSKRVFKVMEEKGWHKARLLDATGTPFNPDNNPRDQFERKAINALAWGNAYIERVEKIEGIYYLRAATSVTAVTEGCTICHLDKKVGDLLGAISYTIPLEE
ncbi:MAG: DUF3365 domain-containing protein [Candidatus Scalindua sp.]